MRASQRGSLTKDVGLKPVTYLGIQGCRSARCSRLCSFLLWREPSCWWHITEIWEMMGDEEKVRLLSPVPPRLTVSFVFLLSVVSRKARAVYPCEAEHSSELSFEIGAIFEDGKCLWGFVVGCCLSPQNFYDPEQAVTGRSVVGVTSLCLTLWAGESWPICLSPELDARACALAAGAPLLL